MTSKDGKVEGGVTEYWGLSRVATEGRGGTRLDEGVGTVIGRPGGQVGGASHENTMTPKEGDSGKTKMTLSPTRHRTLVLMGQIPLEVRRPAEVNCLWGHR